MPPFAVEHDSALTAWGQIHRDLRRRIDSGEFAVGTRIPSEVDLAEGYEVSRMTVRRATSALIEDGYVISRRGSGTYVRERGDVRCDLDLTRPWREQIVSTGHQAVSKLVETHPSTGIPADIAAIFTAEARGRRVTFGRHIQTVDGVPIAVTESWYTEFTQPELAARSAEDDVVEEHGFVEVGFATAAQAELLRSFLDIPLIVVITRSSLARSGETVEISRTSWVGSRVRLVHGRRIRLGEIDMTQLRADVERDAL